MRVRECPVCGKKFEQDHGNRKYCGAECRKAGERERKRRHYRRHREEKLAQCRLWRKEHKEFLKEYNRKYYWAHRERILKRSKNWREANPERLKAYQAERRRLIKEGKIEPKKAARKLSPKERQIRADGSESYALSRQKPLGCNFKGDCLNCPLEACVEE